MYIYTKNGYRRVYVYGGSGLFDSIANILKGLFSSASSKVLSSGATELAKKAISEAGKNALELGKTAASSAGKYAAEKAINKVSSMFKGDDTTMPVIGSTPMNITEDTNMKINRVLSKHNIDPFMNINSLIDGSGLMRYSSIK